MSRASHHEVDLGEELRDAVRFDYYLWERPNSVPDWLEVSSEVEGEVEQRRTKQDTIRRAGYWEKVIPEFKEMERRQWNRNTAVAYFTSDVLKVSESNQPCWYLFHYQQGKVKAYRYEG